MKLQKINELEQSWHKCPHCDYKAKHKNILIKHLEFAHALGVK